MTTSIREIVFNALACQYLSIEAEESLRQLMQGKYGADDFEALMSLQGAFLAGTLRQESRERLAATHARAAQAKRDLAPDRYSLDQQSADHSPKVLSYA
jgi:hypothetical protein